ncbi:MAG: sensor domain-containing protein [Dehalococcoidia bacterium]
MSVSTQRRFFGVVADPQSYINILYLLLSFPLGIAYFVFLVTGISLGFGLLIIWVGVPILALVVAGSWAMCEFERILAVSLLKEDIPHTTRGRSTVTDDQNLSSVEHLFVGTWRRFKSHLTNRQTWTGMLYLFLKFPLGIASFTIAVTLIAVTLGLLTAPAYMWTSDPLEWGSWTFDPFPYSWILPFLGVPALFISFHLMNGMAVVSGQLTRTMLGKLN